MKNFIKVIAFAFVMVLGANSAVAQSLSQNEDRPEVIAKKHTELLVDKLGLDGDQQRTVFRALVSKEINYKKLVVGQDISDPAVVANKKKVDASLDSVMKKTLTAEQYKKWLVTLQN
ncbi:hypothetical protein [Ulvibacter litoralis]|uniref:LTXXQ motif family protein n=1 Tax=Ulvibacter litoralis TaxID=227084 RepID=A0A1G7GDA8_9FLAO|nr:hypothetical protein [Ulvibacter litoralis]GHC56666.1 hypothetical protein GCM10008083_21560 [Ulvibacter litoralis]SDE86127.1 hypothetical protein SAMN05421855_10363 [Ulvibacter litoralis]